MQPDTPEPPFVSVIIPTYNDNARLEVCLDALANQSYPPSRFEVLVIDNGSDHPPDAIVRRLANATLLHEAKPGSYAARNTGIRSARGGVLAFTDADCIPGAQWLENGVRRLAQARVPTIVGGPMAIFYRDDSRPTWIELYEKLYAFPNEQNIREKHFVMTGNLFVSAEVMAGVGAFDAELRSGGDAEWGQRAYAQGVDIVYAEDTGVLHPARHTWAEHTNKVRRVAGGQVDRARNAPRPLVLNRIFYYDFLPPLTTLKKLFRAEGFTWAEKSKILAVVLCTRLVAISEKLSLVLLGRERRR
jgi:glycosyltransferase involved in cell wall biosynthesis